MCWRDDVVMERHCSFCGQVYYGSLGHDCPMFRKQPKTTQPQAKTQKEDEEWVCDGCKDKPNGKKHKCQVQRESIPFSAVRRFCACPCNTPF